LSGKLFPLTKGERLRMRRSPHIEKLMGRRCPPDGLQRNADDAPYPDADCMSSELMCTAASCLLADLDTIFAVPETRLSTPERVRTSAMGGGLGAHTACGPWGG
jgi:hypothetical protein